MGKFYNISTDPTLGGNSASDDTVSSQKAVKDYVDSHGGGSVNIDNSTITLNSDDEIQTVGVIDNRSGSTLKLWTGTRSQYDAIQNKDANTLYNITDDTGDLGTFANVDLSNLSTTGQNNIVSFALANFQNTDSSKVGYVYQTSTAPNVSISTPNIANSKWLILQAILTNSSGVAYYIEGTGGIRNRAGTIVDGNTVCVSSASYHSVFAAIRIQ